MKQQDSIIDDDDDDRLDFKILMHHKADASSSSSESSIRSTSDNEVWPLYLTTHFVDHYVLGDVIGNGAYAEVRECVDIRNLERCAVKIVNKDYLRRRAPTALSNQMQEIKLLRRLKHDNVIQLKETLFKSAKIYIFLEYCSFVLSDLLREQENKRLPIGIARNLFNQMLQGLEYLHSQNIVHRDIKPHNLLITTSGKLKIIDLGVSHILSIWDWPSDLCVNYEGSPLFQAPEVVSGQSKYAGFKVDTWSAGVTLYMILYGQYPFFDEALLGLYDKILSQPLSVPNIQPICQGSNDCLLHQQRFILRDLLSAMLEKEASKRLSIGQALKHPWLKLRENQIVEVSSKCQEDYFSHGESLDEHSEFIELLHRHPSLSSRKNIASVKQKDTPSSSSNNNSPEDERESDLSNENSVFKQRDIYLSMSVLPYLYNHHFSHIPVVKANSSRSDSSNSSSSTTCTSTPTSITSSFQQSPSVSPTTEVSSNSNNSNSNNSSPSPSPTTSDSSSDPNELITEKQFEWGTREQYNLLKLPLIRANRLKSTRKKKRQIRRRPRK